MELHHRFMGKNRTYWKFIHDNGGFPSARFDCQMVPPPSHKLYLYTIYLYICNYIYVIICGPLWSICTDRKTCEMAVRTTIGAGKE